MENLDALSRRERLKCRPVLMEAVNACGEKCFHQAHYIFKDDEGNSIPSDACPINCRVTNLEVDTDKIRRKDDCFEVEGSYLVRVWFEFKNKKGEQDVKVASERFKFQVKVPVETDFDSVLCSDVEFCVVTRNLKCIRAEVEDVRRSNAIRVVVENHLFVLEQGETLVCLPVCPTNSCACIPPENKAKPDKCYPFYEEPTCDEWCFEDDIKCPDACNECPPPTTRKDECKKERDRKDHDRKDRDRKDRDRKDCDRKDRDRKDDCKKDKYREAYDYLFEAEENKEDNIEEEE